MSICKFLVKCATSNAGLCDLTLQFNAKGTPENSYNIKFKPKVKKDVAFDCKKQKLPRNV